MLISHVFALNETRRTPFRYFNSLILCSGMELPQ